MSTRRHDTIFLRGLEVEVHGVRAFCPMSQIDVRFVGDPASLVGQKLQFRVQKADERDVVLSRRALLEAERAGQPVRDIAEAFAADRFARVKSQAEDGAWTRTALEFALARYRNGWLPARLVQRLSSRYFRGLVG